jgi:aryl-alcohol dehydrogenase-like predicted oxidoreductase
MPASERAHASAADRVPTARFIGQIPVSAIGLGRGAWSFNDHPAWIEAGLAGQVDDEQAIRTIHSAIDYGVRLIDTARVYTTLDHPGHGEALIARALADHPAGSAVLVATKGGHYREVNDFPIDTSPDTIRRHCETSLRMLGLEQIGLYQLHHPDPERTMAEVMATFAELREEGAIEHIGLSNVSIAQLEEAMSVVPIASVQNHFSPFEQGDRAMVDYCAERSIAYLSYSPLGGLPGNPSGVSATTLGESFPVAAALARRKDVSIQQLALAWMLSLSPTLIAISGARRPETIRDSALAAELAVSDEDIAELDF